LYAIALNHCRVEFRKRPPHLSLEVEGKPLSEELSPVDSCVAIETASLVSTAVRQLPTQQQMVVVLRVWQGLTYSDIAESMGITEGTVRAHMHHALNTLRRSLEPFV
jgi:RNA polymerase sigma factor (sigma-70 family)